MLEHWYVLKVTLLPQVVLSGWAVDIAPSARH
jgi:hypothetical protein